jgi:transposase
MAMRNGQLMPGPRHYLNDDEIVARYLAGESPTELAPHYGCSPETIRRRIRERATLRTAGDATRLRFALHPEAIEQAREAQKLGVAIRKVPTPPTVELLAMYETSSVMTVAAHYGVSGTTVIRWLDELKVDRRDKSEAGILRTSLLPREELERQLAILHAAAPDYEKAAINGAASREGTEWIIGRGEPELRAMLDARGVETVPQKAVYHYNIDLAAAPVAIEVHNNMGHPYRWSRIITRTAELSERGWLVWYVWITEEEIIQEIVADQIACWYEQLCAGDPSVSRHRVIRGDGEVCDNNVSRRAVGNPSGQYKRRSPTGTRRRTPYEHIEPPIRLAWG